MGQILPYLGCVPEKALKTPEGQAAVRELMRNRKILEAAGVKLPDLVTCNPMEEPLRLAQLPDVPNGLFTGPTVPPETTIESEKPNVSDSWMMPAATESENPDVSDGRMPSPTDSEEVTDPPPTLTDGEMSPTDDGSESLTPDITASPGVTGGTDPLTPDITFRPGLTGGRDGVFVIPPMLPPREAALLQLVSRLIEKLTPQKKPKPKPSKGKGKATKGVALGEPARRKEKDKLDKMLDFSTKKTSKGTLASPPAGTDASGRAIATSGSGGQGGGLT